MSSLRIVSTQTLCVDLLNDRRCLAIHDKLIRNFISNKIEYVKQDTNASQVGIVAGDEIYKINDKKIISKKQVDTIMYNNHGENLEIEIIRNGEKITYEVAPYKEEYVSTGFSVDENNVIVVKDLSEGEKNKEIEKTAKQVESCLLKENISEIRISYGTIVNEIKEVSRSYKEARMALDVGKIFFDERSIIAYNELGIGRLIYQLPVSLCQMFIEEIFDEGVPNEMDDETLITINTFLDNNLNVSETARQLYVHRNTLLYRLEKLEKLTGLDIRIFDDALTLKIALMVVNYMRYLEKTEY